MKAPVFNPNAATPIPGGLVAKQISYQGITNAMPMETEDNAAPRYDAGMVDLIEPDIRQGPQTRGAFESANPNFAVRPKRQASATP